MIDSHCHLADAVFEADRQAVLDRAQAGGVERLLCVLAAGDARESIAARAIRACWPIVQFTVGVHPHAAGAFEGRIEDAVHTVRTAVADHAARAIGEIGLDYHYDFAPRALQQSVFAAQLSLARELDLPVVIHSREAADDTFHALAEVGGGELRGVFHCFTGDLAMARAVLDLGFHVSFGGILTFPRAAELREVARVVPPDRLLIETDAPYLAPVPHRGTRNEPALVGRVLENLAALRGVPTPELGAQVIRNYDSLFGPTGTQHTA